MLIPTISGAEGGQVPPSTNPANRVIFPANGRDTDQQMKDQLESYNWATAQTKWDPYEAHEVLVQKGYAAAQTAESAQGGLTGGARSRRKRAAVQSAADQAIQEFQSKFEVWDKNWSASMEGRGYTVK